MIGLVLAQDVVDEIGRDRDLPPRLLLPRKPPLDQAGNHGAVPERAFHQRGFGEPILQVVAEHVLREQLVKKAGVAPMAVMSRMP